MLIYLHGLNSSSNSRKAGMLRDQLAPIPVLAPSYPAHRPDQAVDSLWQFLYGLRQERGEGFAPFVVGSSMGGFYGQYLARRCRFAHLFMINPALQPWRLFSVYEGREQTTADGETYRVTRALIESTRRFGVEQVCDGVPTTLFLDRGDEVIDYTMAEAIYRECGRMFLFDDGDHAFAHMSEAIAVIRGELRAAPHRGR
mgnify:CR=1 FL=1